MKEVEVGSECRPCLDCGLGSHRRTEEPLENANRNLVSQTSRNPPQHTFCRLPGQWVEAVRFEIQRPCPGPNL